MASSDLFGSKDIFQDFESERPSMLKTKLDTSGSEGLVQEAANGRNEIQEVFRENVANNMEKNNLEAIETLQTNLKHNMEDKKKFIEAFSALESGCNAPEVDYPAFQILFYNNSFSRKYRGDIEKFVRKLYEKEKRERDVLPSLSCPRAIDLSKAPCPESTQHQLHCRKRKRCSSDQRIIGSTVMYDGYQLDKMGWPIVSNNPAMTDSYEAPTFLHEYGDKAQPHVSEEDTTPMKMKRSSKQCWNCGGEHNLNDCREPRDHAKIAQARAEFMQSKSHQPLNARYTDDTADASKYKPGVISDQLRAALGLKPNTLPLWIYRMRRFGYPPGWAAHAQQQATSGIVVHDRDGKVVDKYGDSLEEGEVDSGDFQEATDCQSAIFRYPGFNVPAPPGTIDLSRELKEREFNPEQSITKLSQEIFPKQLTTPTPRRQPPVLQRAPLADMDVEVQIHNPRIECPPPLPSEPEPPQPPLPSGSQPLPPLTRALTQGSDEDGELQRLEREKEMILAQLEQENEAYGDSFTVIDICSDSESGPPTQTNVINLDSDSADEANAVIAVDVASPENVAILDKQTEDLFEPGAASEAVSVADDVTPAANDEDNSVDLVTPPRVLNSRSMSLGTPLSRRSLTMPSLPSAESFSQNVTEHIPYENLPGATGTFKRMQSVIDKVRQTHRKK